MGTCVHANKHAIGILIGLAILSASTTQAQFHFGEPENLGPVFNSSYDEGDPELSVDGLVLFFHSNRSGGQGGYDIWMTRRDSVSDPWQTPINLGPPVNSSLNEFHPSISTDGLSLYFACGRPGGDLWMAVRASPSDPWGEVLPLGPVVDSSSDDTGPDISADGLTLLFYSNRPGGEGDWDMWTTTRASVEDPWQPPINLGPTVNGPYEDRAPSLSTDNLTLFFFSNRPGGEGDYDIWMTTRLTSVDPWTPPMPLPPPVNTASSDSGQNISPDGRTLYFVSRRPGGYGAADAYQVAIFPCHGDLNRDGEVGLADLTLLLAHFGITSGMSYPDGDLDGDGDVDLADLSEFLSRYGVPCP